MGVNRETKIKPIYDKYKFFFDYTQTYHKVPFKEIYSHASFGGLRTSSSK